MSGRRRLRPGPIAALLSLVLLVAWVVVKETRRNEATAGADSGRVLTFERPALRAVSIAHGGGTVRVEKKGEGWEITAPLSAAADGEAVEGLLTSLETARIDRRLGPQVDRKPYGLDPPATTITLETAQGSPLTLGVGDTHPIGGTFYVALPGTGDVAVVTSAIGDAAQSDLARLRDKSLLAFDPWKTKRLRLERGRESVLLEKVGEEWRLRAPVDSPADGPTVSDLLHAFERLKVRTFVEEKPSAADLRRHGLLAPQARLTVLQEGWDVEKTVLFGNRSGDDLFARTVGREPLLAVPADFKEKIDTRVFDLRRKEILGLGQYRLKTITAVRDGGPALTLTRGDDGSWSAGGAATGAVKAETIDTLLGTLANLKTVAFDDHPAESLKTGLARRPVLDLVLQEEPETTGGEGRTQHLVFGGVTAGRALARDMAWGSLSRIDAGPLSILREQIDAAALEAATPPTPAPSPAVSPGPSATPD